MNKIIAIDQSTSSTKAMLFDEQCRMLARCHVDHQQYYPKAGWVEHDAQEIYDNTVKAIRQLILHEECGIKEEETTCEKNSSPIDSSCYSLAITNQRETVVVWNWITGVPVYHALVWQDNRGAALCQQLKEEGETTRVLEKSGLLIDPNFSATGVRWILDNVEGARQDAEDGKLLM